jgi:hypothetical protein
VWDADRRVTVQTGRTLADAALVRQRRVGRNGHDRSVIESEQHLIEAVLE